MVRGTRGDVVAEKKTRRFIIAANRYLMYASRITNTWTIGRRDRHVPEHCSLVSLDSLPKEYSFRLFINLVRPKKSSGIPLIFR